MTRDVIVALNLRDGQDYATATLPIGRARAALIVTDPNQLHGIHTSEHRVHQTWRSAGNPRHAAIIGQLAAKVRIGAVR